MNLKIKPETYKTLLQERYNNLTELIKLRKKISQMEHKGLLCSKKIQSDKKSLTKIFFDIQKNYFIVFTKKYCYYCENINTNRNSISLINSYILKENKWVNTNNINISISEVLLCF